VAEAQRGAQQSVRAIAGWLGQRYLAGFVDRVDPVKGLVLPLLTAVFLTLFITALAAMRHVRTALALQPIEALSLPQDAPLNRRADAWSHVETPLERST
jgi:hypothetical protein